MQAAHGRKARDAMIDHLHKSRRGADDMQHPLPTSILAAVSSNKITVGDWVQVDSEYGVGFCSEGGAGMIVKLDAFTATVRYILAGTTESMVALRRMFIIPMPHRGEKAVLRVRTTPHVR